MEIPKNQIIQKSSQEQPITCQTINPESINQDNSPQNSESNQLYETSQFKNEKNNDLIYETQVFSR